MVSGLLPHSLPPGSLIRTSLRTILQPLGLPTWSNTQRSTGVPNHWALDSGEFREGVCSVDRAFVHLYVYSPPDNYVFSNGSKSCCSLK